MLGISETPDVSFDHPLLRRRFGEISGGMIRFSPDIQFGTPWHNGQTEWGIYLIRDAVGPS